MLTHLALRVFKNMSLIITFLELLAVSANNEQNSEVEDIRV